MKTNFIIVNDNRDIVNIEMITRIINTNKGCEIYTRTDYISEYSSKIKSELRACQILKKIEDAI